MGREAAAREDLREAYRMFTDEERSTYDTSINALRKRFESVEIEELKGLEFHHKTQGTESVEQLGVKLSQQQLLTRT